MAGYLLIESRDPFGSTGVSQTWDLASDLRDLRKLLDEGGTLYFVQEDAAERGIEPEELLEGATPVDRAGLADLFEGYPQVWNW